MAKQRMINTKFWDDSYISNLDPIEKLMFLYILTNPETNICGIYELPLKKIALDTGIEKEMVQKIFDRFSSDKKVFYIKNGWVCIKNFVKHQNIRSPKILVGIQAEIDRIPNDILKEAKRYGYRIHTISHSNSNPNSNSKADRVGASDSLFEKVFEIYPKKSAKDEAKAQWSALKPSQILAETIISDVHHRLKSQQWTEQNGRYIPKLVNYLEQCQWKLPQEKPVEIRVYGKKTSPQND